MRILLPAAAFLGFVLPASAGNAEAPKKVVVEEKTVVCVANGKEEPRCTTTTGGDAGTSVDVQVTRDGQKVEKKVVVIRRPMLEAADADKDGQVSKAEFMAWSEKHFAEMDRDRNGALSKDEAMPVMPAGMNIDIDEAPAG